MDIHFISGLAKFKSFKYALHAYLLHELDNMNRGYLHVGLGTKKKKKIFLSFFSSNFFKSGKLFSEALIQESNEVCLNVLLC